MVPVENPAATRRRMMRAVSFSLSGFADALLLEVFAGESFFIGAGVAVGEVCSTSGWRRLGLQILADATLAELFILVRRRA